MSRFVLILLATIGVFSACRAGAGGEPDPAFAEFASWLNRFEKGNGDIQNGVEIAKRRAQLMIALIQKDPKRALELAVSKERRAALPEAVAVHVERQVSGQGSLMVGVADDFEHGESRTFREAMLEGKTYRAFVHGSRLERASETNTRISGIVLGDLAAIEDI